MTRKLPWLDADTPLPDASQALSEPNGLVAAGLDLSVARLEQAYRQGIFPWFNPGEPVLWWSPDPRTVLFCEELHISHSLRKRLRQIDKAQAAGDFSACVVTTDCCFPTVMQACAIRPRAATSGTWITPEMLAVYCQWHALGRAHSIEAWMNGQLAGGLYGVSIGTMFYGESMFSRQTDASKIALVHLVRYLQQRGVTLIDCQMATPHLMSMGAREIGRSQFLAHVQATTQAASLDWAPGRLDLQGNWHRDVPDFVVTQNHSSSRIV